MTPDTVLLLRKSFQRVEAQGRIAALVFYQRLFERDPSLRTLFKNDIELQSQKLIDMVAQLLSLLERSHEVMATLAALGARHLQYGVKEKDYATVGAAFLEMLSAVLGPAFTDEVRDAWTGLYQAISAGMLAGARSASEQAA